MQTATEAFVVHPSFVCLDLNILTIFGELTNKHVLSVCGIASQGIFWKEISCVIEKHEQTLVSNAEMLKVLMDL